MWVECAESIACVPSVIVLAEFLSIANSMLINANLYNVKHFLGQMRMKLDKTKSRPQMTTQFYGLITQKSSGQCFFHGKL